MEKVLILGAGKVGIIVAKMISKVFSNTRNKLEVIIVDNHEQSEFDETWISIGGQPGAVEFISADLRDPYKLKYLMLGMDLVIACLPVSIMKLTVPGRICAESGTHYIDVTEDIYLTNTHRTFDAMAEENGCFLIPQCGLAPGLINVLANDIYSRFNKPIDLKLAVGALPRTPVGSLGYALTWSVEGLINEYVNPCYAVVNGKGQTTQPLEDLETVIIDGMTFEAFNTSGGLGSLSETLTPVNMSYKTLRYPGHRDLMKFLLHELKLTDKREVLQQILKDAIPTTNDDRVILRVVGTGLIDGALHQLSTTKVIDGLPDGNISALQLTTGFGVAAVVELLYDGVIKDTLRKNGGLVLLENVLTEKLLAKTSMNAEFIVI